jgi:hypothetical protein
VWQGDKQRGSGEPGVPQSFQGYTPNDQKTSH